MKQDNTEDEVRKEHIDNLGNELGPIFHELYNDFLWLRVKWSEYRELFGTKPERLDILNSSAGTFFRIVQITLWDDMLLHLSRLTDKTSVGRKENMTIQRLPDLCQNGDLRNSVQDLVDKAIEATDFARDWRNRHIGHRDFDLAVNHNANPLKTASRKRVDEAISAIYTVLNHIYKQRLNITMDNETIPLICGAEQLLYTLHEGLSAKHAREERISSGQSNPEDFISPDI